MDGLRDPATGRYMWGDITHLATIPTFLLTAAIAGITGTLWLLLTAAALIGAYAIGGIAWYTIAPIIDRARSK